MKTSWAERPYPKIEDPKLKVAIAFIIGLNVFIFLEIFRPFGIELIHDNTPFVAGFGGCVALSLLISYFFLPKIIPFMRKEDWRLKHEIGFHTVNFILTGTLNYLYNTEFGQGISPQHSLPEFILITVAVGLSPLTMLAYFTERFLSGKNKEQADRINAELGGETEVVKNSKRVNIQSQLDESLELTQEQFLMAKSEGNYSLIHYLDDQGLQKQLLRLTLKNLQEQLDDHGIHRVHKSYLVNIHHVQKVEGNARSLVLILEHNLAPVPVSRSFDRALLLSR